MNRGLRGALILIGSQAIAWGLAPSASGAGAEHGAWRIQRGPAAPAGAAGAPALPSHGAPVDPELVRRVQLRRSVPDHFGPPPRGPWVSGRHAPLLAPRAGGRLARSTAFAGTADTVRVLGLRIDFETDRLGSQTTTLDGRFDLRNGESLGIAIDPPPHNRDYFLSHLEAMARYWRWASSGKLEVQYDVYPKAENGSYRLGDTGDYGPWTLGQASYASAQSFFRDAIQIADQSDSIPFGDYDVIVIFHAGSDFQADVKGDSPRDFPTFQIGLVDSVAVNGGAVGIHGGMVIPETENQDGLYGAMNGTLAHEFGHTQGLPDMYDINTFFPAIGVWSNMDSGYLLSTYVQDQKTGAIVAVSGILPVSLDPWCKSLLWPDGLQMVDPGHSLTTSLRSSQLSDRLLRVPLGADEYFLVENRQTDLNGDNAVYLDRDSTTHVILGPGLSSEDPTDSLGDKEYDFLLPGQGILVWHVDESVICVLEGDSAYCPPNANPDYGVNSNPDRLGVGLLEASGIRDIGNPYSPYFFGGPFDPYFVGNHTRVSSDTNPSSRTNDGGSSHVTIDVTSAAAVDMDLTIESEWRLQGWPVVAGAHDLTLSAPTYGSMRHDGRRSVVIAADSTVLAWMADGAPYYTSSSDGTWATLPAAIVGPVLFADSLFQSNPSLGSGSGVVATATDGNVYAFRPGLQTDATSTPLLGWPPPLNGAGPAVSATTGPVLAPAVGPMQTPSRSVLVGGSDGRVYVISPSVDETAPPVVSPVSDTLMVSGSPVVSPVVGNLAVGRFTGAGGYVVAYALENGMIRLVGEPGKDPSRYEALWTAGGSGFAPYLLGVDMDRAADRNLEVVVGDPARGLIHCYDISGRELSGWPVSVASPLAGPVATGDLDGDGYPEIFALDRDGNAHRWNRNGVETAGWPISMTSRYGSGALGGVASPVVGDVDGDGRPEVLFQLANGLLAALKPDASEAAGWPMSVPGAADPTPLFLSLNGPGFVPDPPGPAWLHLVAGGAYDGRLGAYQLPARADSALFSTDGSSGRMPWIGYGGNRRRSSVLEDDDLKPATTTSKALAAGSVYCYPNPTRGSEINLAYTLGANVTSVDIRVLDPSGQEVQHLTGSPQPTQNVSQIPVQNLSSGVYIVRIEARRGASTEVAFQKFAVVR
jgi:M6 family metalloprotease-like protein